MNKVEAEKIEKAEAACFDATCEVHRQAKRHGTSIICEYDGVPVVKWPLNDDELKIRIRQAYKESQRASL